MEKLRKELSNPNLIPQPYIFNNNIQDSSDKFKKIINELVSDYNHKIVNFVEEERKIAFEAGKKEGMKISTKN